MEDKRKVSFEEGEMLGNAFKKKNILLLICFEITFYKKKKKIK